MGLAIVSLNSVGHAYQVIQRLFTAENSLKLLEMIPYREGAGLLVLGDSGPLREFGASIHENEGVTTVFVEKHTETLLKAFYSLEQKALGQHMVVFESENPGEIFSMGEAACQFGFEVIDLKIQRGGQQMGLIVLSTDDADAITSLPRFEGSGRNLAVIRDRSPAFARFFPIAEMAKL